MLVHRQHPGHVLVVSPNEHTQHLAHRLSDIAGFEVTIVETADEALQRLLVDDWHVMILDPDMLDDSSATLICHARSSISGLAVATFGRGSAASQHEHLSITVLPDGENELASLLAASRMIEAAVQRRLRGVETVLAIGAHPDDVEIGAGGTLLAHRSAGHAVNVLTLSCGAAGGDVDQRELEARRAAHSMGARLFLESLEDTKISAGHPTVGLIERVIDIVRPTTIYTHSLHDTHQDHRAVHQATLVAARGVARVFAYQSPSATIDFRPTRFVPIDAHHEAKLQVVGAYESQVARCDYLRESVISATSRYWSRFTNVEFAEALEVIRDATSFSVDNHVVDNVRHEESLHVA